MTQANLFNNLIENGVFEDKLTSGYLSLFSGKHIFLIDRIFTRGGGNRYNTVPYDKDTLYLTSDKFLPIFCGDYLTAPDYIKITLPNGFELKFDSNYNMDDGILYLKLVNLSDIPLDECLSITISIGWIRE